MTHPRVQVSADVTSEDGADAARLLYHVALLQVTWPVAMATAAHSTHTARHRRPLPSPPPPTAAPATAAAAAAAATAATTAAAAPPTWKPLPGRRLCAIFERNPLSSSTLTFPRGACRR